VTITAMDSGSLRVPTQWRVLTEWLPQGSIAMSPIKILFAFAGMMSLLMVLAIQRLPGEERIEVPKVEPLPLAQKTDPVFSVAPPKMVAPVRIIDTSKLITERVAAPTDAPVAEPPVAREGPRPAAKRVAEVTENNICTRHNMRKVMTRGGRSWRCRR
jgi:hypothetical protein